MLDPVVLIGEPLNYKNKIKIYPPTVKQVVTNPNFGVFYKLLSITQEDIKDELNGKLGQGEKLPTPFQYLLLHTKYVDGFGALLRGAFQFFCQTDVGFLFEEQKI